MLKANKPAKPVKAARFAWFITGVLIGSGGVISALVYFNIITIAGA